MKNRHLSVLVISAALIGGFIVTGCKPEVPVEEVTKLEFEQNEYTIKSGDKVTVKGDLEGVTYSFQGGTPEGVTLNETTGEITYDESVDSLPEKIYIATKGEESVSCTIKFTVNPVLPNVEIKNVSSYFVSGDKVVADAISDGGTVFAIEYSLKGEVNGISIDSQTGVVTFSSDVEDGTSFTVAATSKGVVAEKTFIAMTKNIIGSSTKIQIIKKGSNEEPSFVLDFNGNVEGDTATTKENISYAINNEIAKDNTGISYDESSKTVTIHHEILEGLTSGEIDFKVLTQRNSVSLNLIIADNFIYTAKDFYDIFEPNYDKAAPSYKEGSLNGYYVLGADIDFEEYLTNEGNNAGKGWFPIGAYNDGLFDIPFEGTFNGNGHTLSNFWYKKAADVNGLFGRIGTNGVVKNFTITGEIPEDGVASWSGVISGNNAGTIKNVISDVALPNGGHSATGVFASVNHGLIENCISLSTHVKGYNETAQNWQKAGIAVGLNETDGTMKNVYAVSEDLDDSGEFKYGLFGCSNTESVTSESAGKLFTSVDDLKAYDFSSALTDEVWKLEENEVPELNVEFVPLSVGYMKIKNAPSYVLKGDKLNMETLILPSEYQSEFENQVVYEISGVNGVVVNGNELDFTNVEESGVATISAKLTINGVEFIDSVQVSVYLGLEAVTVDVKEPYYEAGSTYKLDVITTPEVSDLNVTYTLGSDIGWRRCYVKLSGDTIKIMDDIPASVESITITAEALGVTSEAKVIPIKHLNTLNNSNVIHYNGEEALTFDYTLPEGKVASKVRLADVELSSDQFSVEGNVLKVNPDMIVAFSNTSLKLTIEDEDGNIYRAFATYAAEDKVTEEWLLNAFGRADINYINSMEDFNSYFAYDGETHTDLVQNMRKVYVLNCDLDFASVTNFRAIGNNLDAADSGVHFTGKFYGMGHSIKNVNITYAERSWEITGFFRQIDEGGVVRDVNFENCNISKPGGNNGGIVSGYLGGEGKLINVNAIDCSVTIGDYIVSNNGGIQLGGLVGRPYTIPQYCTFNGYDINLIGVR